MVFNSKEEELESALTHAKKAYKIANVQGEREKMIEYAKRIQALEKELGRKPSSFPKLGL